MITKKLGLSILTSSILLLNACQNQTEAEEDEIEDEKRQSIQQSIDNDVVVLGLIEGTSQNSSGAMLSSQGIKIPEEITILTDDKELSRTKFSSGGEFSFLFSRSIFSETRYLIVEAGDYRAVINPNEDLGEYRIVLNDTATRTYELYERVKKYLVENGLDQSILVDLKKVRELAAMLREAQNLAGADDTDEDVVASDSNAMDTIAQDYVRIEQQSEGGSDAAESNKQTADGVQDGEDEVNQELNESINPLVQGAELEESPMEALSEETPVDQNGNGNPESIIDTIADGEVVAIGVEVEQSSGGSESTNPQEISLLPSSPEDAAVTGETGLRLGDSTRHYQITGGDSLSAEGFTFEAQVTLGSLERLSKTSRQFLFSIRNQVPYTRENGQEKIRRPELLRVWMEIPPESRADRYPRIVAKWLVNANNEDHERSEARALARGKSYDRSEKIYRNRVVRSNHRQNLLDAEGEHTIRIEFSQAEFRLFVDGQTVASKSINRVLVPICDNADAYIGGQNSSRRFPSGRYFFDGQVKNLRMNNVDWTSNSL